MKNLFFVSVAFSVFSGTSLTANAQTSIKFIDGIVLTASSSAGSIASSAPLPVEPTPALWKKADAVAAPAMEMFNSLQFKYAQIMDVEVEKVTNLSLYEFIDEWFGTSYRYGGTTKKGIDCSSLTGQLINAVYGISVPRTAREQFANTQRIPKEDLQEGDLVFFNTTGGISHVGLFLGDGNFVHASSSQGVTISNLSETYFAKRYRGAGRMMTQPTHGVAKNLL